MANNNRPTSPHLQIYRLPLTAKMSISHRITGVILSAGLVLTVLFLTALADGQSSWEIAHAILANGLGLIVLFVFSLVLNYHMCNGIRHLFWDIGHGYDLEVASRANKLVLAASVVLTLLVWIVALAA
ncbi:MAG: succinate dehydrogenase, cytochrome b556 subunit [Gammaproteobacteria bacterium]|nr:succinate dehydrogenase, cytochrome b556 subunit [Gammaproteobacteria bacterium]